MPWRIRKLARAFLCGGHANVGHLQVLNCNRDLFVCVAPVGGFLTHES